MITIDENRCTRCGICIPICVRKILRLGEKNVEVTDQLMCIACGHCKAVCPTDAPRFTTGNEDFVPVPTKEEIPNPAPFLRRRRSLRKYEKRLVEKEKLEWVVQAGRYAPTGGNRQACEFTAVNGRKILDKVCTLAIGTLLEEGKKIFMGLVSRRSSARRGLYFQKYQFPQELYYTSFLSIAKGRV